MTQNTRYQFWIIAAAAIIFFTYLGAASLWDEDETLYASIAREMIGSRRLGSADVQRASIS